MHTLQNGFLSIAGLAWATLLPAQAASVADLVRAYPEARLRIEGPALIWPDGTRMAIDDGRGGKSAEERLADPDLKDMVLQTYPAGAPIATPAPDFDPGRARNAAFFNQLYGDCRKGEVTANLVKVAWLPSKHGQPVLFNARHGAATRLAAVSARLDALPSTFDAYLLPTAGTYHCRPIAGTTRLSAHGHAIAIDIAVGHAHYWRWPTAGRPGVSPYANAIPAEIVAAFEAEGFIWGGRWSHYDTMHFEYRPELTPAPPR